MKKSRNISRSLTIGWLYPELMSTYGDTGNVTILRSRCSWREVDVSVTPITFGTSEKEIEACDIILGGGAQDRQQLLVAEDLVKYKKKILHEVFTNGVVGVFVCGSPQLLGHWYSTGNGDKLDGLGIFDMATEHPGSDVPRLIGNTVGEVIDDRFLQFAPQNIRTIVGFENHGGRTTLGPGVLPFARVVHGKGNNGLDGWEGAVFNNCIATYYHGPLFAKNPHIADWAIATALVRKYNKKVQLSNIDDMFAWKAHQQCLMRGGALPRGI